MYYIIDHNGRQDKVSVDRLKVAYVPTSQQTNIANTKQPVGSKQQQSQPQVSGQLPTTGVITRYGRKVRKPPRFVNHQ